MIYPAIQIGTQWVMTGPFPKVPWRGLVVDVTTSTLELYFHDPDDNRPVVGLEFILAAYPKIEGVPLIPEVAFKNDNADEWKRYYPAKLGLSPDEWGEVIDHFKKPENKFYTREDMIEFARKAICYIHPEGADLTPEIEGVLAIFEAKKITPTEIDCAENEDGSLKIVDDTIVLNEVIR